MKKGILSLVAFFVATVICAQVDSYTIAASKTYKNRTKTVYLNLSAVLDAEAAKMIEQGMEAQSDIHLFSFYAAPDYQKCMFTSALNVHEDEIMALMNEVVFDAKPAAKDEIKVSKKIRDKASLNTKPAIVYERKFANHVKQGDSFKAVFKLDSNLDEETMQQISITLKENDFITDANYRGNARFEIFAFEPIYPEQVNQLLEQYNVKISEDSIKHK